MINSLFYGYLSPRWKRLVRTAITFIFLFWVFLFFENGLDEDVLFIIIISLVINLFLSFGLELFVKKKQQNEIWVSILSLTLNIVITFLFFIST